jgi:hypothetical protein
MAKTLAGVLAILMAALLFAACGRDGSEVATTTTLAVTTTSLPKSPPSAPLGLATSGSEYLKLTWSAPESDGRSKIVQYNVEESNDGIKWTIRIVKPVSEYAPLSDNVWRPAPGQTKYVRVSATNGAGTGPYASLTLVNEESPPDPQSRRFTACMSDMMRAAIDGRNFYRDCASEAYG